MKRASGLVALLACTVLVAVSARRLLEDNPEADALPGINLPTRAQLQSFVESREVQQVLGGVAALAPQIAASFAPLVQPAFVRAPAEAPVGFPIIVPNSAVMPRPLPSDPPTPEQTQMRQEGANVIQDGPLRGGILTDQDMPQADPSTAASPESQPAHPPRPQETEAAMPLMNNFAQHQGPVQRPLNMRSFVQESGPHMVSFQERSPTTIPGVLPEPPPLPTDANGVITEGPLRGGVVDQGSGSSYTDPAALPPLLDPRYLRIGGQPVVSGGNAFAEQRTTEVNSPAQAPSPLGLPLVGPVGPFPLQGPQGGIAPQAGHAPSPGAGYQDCWRNERGVVVCCYNDGNGNIGCNPQGSTMAPTVAQGINTAG